jgi:CheY-like chemotaxis protein
MTHSPPILLVEDNPDDVFFMKRAARTAEIVQPLNVVIDGQAAIDYLSGTGEFADATRHPAPCLVLLDLKLPRKCGLEVLQWIRMCEAFKPLPVIMFTTSAVTSDVEQSYRLGANGYLVKPANLNELVSILKALKAFWLDHNLLPALHLKHPPDSQKSPLGH